MHNLGHTRSVRRSSHLIHTPDTFIRSQIPGLLQRECDRACFTRAGRGFYAVFR